MSSGETVEVKEEESNRNRSGNSSGNDAVSCFLDEFDFLIGEQEEEEQSAVSRFLDEFDFSIGEQKEEEEEEEEEEEKSVAIPAQLTLPNTDEKAPLSPTPLPLPPPPSPSTLTDDKKAIEAIFISRLPHKTLLNESAIEFGLPYLPTEDMRVCAEEYWNSENRKEMLNHLRGNLAIDAFVSGFIDTVSCVGFLRSQATEYGYPGLRNLAEMSLETISGRAITNSFLVDREKMTASIYPEEVAKRPDTMHPSSKTCALQEKMVTERNLSCLALDWSDASKTIDYNYSRNICALQNVIVALLLPAYMEESILVVNGELESEVLSSVKVNGKNNLKQLTDVNVMSALSTLPQFFSSSSTIGSSKDIHLYSAPLRLPPFDRHPIINLENSPFFNCATPPSVYGVEGGVLASLSCPSQSVITLNQRRNRKGDKKLLFVSSDGIEVRVVDSTDADSSSSTTKKKRNTNSRTMGDRTRDPVIHMSNKERPLFVRSVLALSGNYGWFSLVLGYIPTLDVLFLGSGNRSGLLNQQCIRKYRNKNVTIAPLRNRRTDVRFHGFELLDAPGYSSCFRIRPATSDQHADVVEGYKNPFYTRFPIPKWYDGNGLGCIFGNVPMLAHVRVMDNQLDKFSILMTTGESDRWKANLQDKLRVFEQCIVVLAARLKAMCSSLSKFGNEVFKQQFKFSKKEGVEALKVASENKKSSVCSVAEASMSEVVAFYKNLKRNKNLRISSESTFDDLVETTTKINQDIDTISLWKMMLEECKKNYVVFKDGEVREAAIDVVKELHRVSARYHVGDLLLRGTKLSLTWQRPHDTRATDTLANVPRCRIPQVVCKIEDEMRYRSMASLQILNTRDYNYRPMRHIMLEIVYGKSIAQDISDLTCMQWLQWCRLSADNGSEAFYAIDYFVTSNMNCDNTTSRYLKRSRDDGVSHDDHEYDTGTDDDSDSGFGESSAASRAIGTLVAKNDDARIINEWIKTDIKDNPYAPIVAPKPPSKKGRKKRQVGDEESTTGEIIDDNEAASTPSCSNFSPVQTYSGPRVCICTARPKSINVMKKSTGRMGFNDVYFVAITCRNKSVSANCKRAASRLGISTDSVDF